jgi:1,2-dihydroxy-3-keto-5-methylthiopentene dioxygenase
MAIVRVPELDRMIEDDGEIRNFLAMIGIDYWRSTPDVPIPAGAPAADVLRAYRTQIEQLSAQGGYVTADVIDVFPETPGLDGMLKKFTSEHWHDEDEVRFIIEGRGVFHVHPPGQPVVAIEVGAGDLIRVPKGTHHWFDLCSDRRIRAIRLFQDPSGWTPHYTSTGIEQDFQPLCFGPAYFPPPAGM